MLNKKLGRQRLSETVEDFYKRKRSTITVKSKVFSFLNAIIIALSFPQYNNHTFVKENNFNLTSNQRNKQGVRRFKIMRNQLKTLAANYLNFKPTLIKHWQLFFNSMNFNLVIILSQNHFRRLCKKAVYSTKKKVFNLFLARYKDQKTNKYHFNAMKRPSGFFNKFVCKKCFKSSKSKSVHCCQYECYMCKSSKRHDKLLKCKTSHCRSCNRY